MTHKEKIKSWASVRCERSENIDTDREVRGHSRTDLDFRPRKTWKMYWLKQFPTSAHTVSPQALTLMISSCTAHTHSLSPLPVVSWLGALEEHRGRWRALTGGTQTLEAIDFVHTLPIVYTRVALAFIHLQFTMYTFETCTNGPHMWFRQKGRGIPAKKAQMCSDGYNPQEHKHFFKDKGTLL